MREAKRARRSPRYSLDSSNDFVSNLVWQSIFLTVNWDPVLLCLCSCVCKKLRLIAKRVLWKEFCLSRAPKMVSDLISGAKRGQIEGGWMALAKLLVYCAGCQPTENFEAGTVSGHVVPRTRFSSTSGQSFLMRPCRTDVLYMTDLCEHDGDVSGVDLGLVRGVFRGFTNSKTRKFLIGRTAQLDDNETCPFCNYKVWSMLTAQMIPKSAGTKLAAYEENVECFVCLNGHVTGKCSLLTISDSE